jgi:hypothetical protein
VGRDYEVFFRRLAQMSEAIQKTYSMQRIPITGNVQNRGVDLL